MSSEIVAGLVVAAGMSSRMKAFKPLMKLGEKTIIEHVVDTLRESEVQEIVVVTGNRAVEIEKQLANRNIHFIRNEDYENTSMFQSVKFGLKHLNNRCDKFFFLPGDIPLFKPSSLRAMKKEMDLGKSRLVQPMYNGKHGHPVLFSADCIKDFLLHDGTMGMKGAMENLKGKKIELELPDKGILMDADTQEDYKILKDYFLNMKTPDQEECMEILKYFKTESDTIKHCIAVTELAKEIAVKLKFADHPLNIKLVEAGALLHDVARKEKEHAVCGAKWLRELDYYEIARIVEEHMNLSEEALKVLDERAVVYLADKLIIGSQRVNIEKRFQRAVNRFGEDSEAMKALRIRMDKAKRTLKSVEEKIGGITYENHIRI